MGKGKLAKFADMEANPLVVECPYWIFKKDGFPMRGHWNADFFRNDNPIVLELGCGRGEYTVGLASRFTNCNFIGVDIKGSRMWTGAQQALKADMKNVGFLRTSIELIDQMFGKDEVAEIWLTFSDPQMKKPTKRLTSTFFMERYRRFLVPNGLVHLKTDSNFMYTYTRLMADHNGLPIVQSTDDLYRSELLADNSVAMQIQTYYEQMWLDRGLTIKYLCLQLPHDVPLAEPDVEIPVDDYRSYDHQVVSTVKMRK